MATENREGIDRRALLEKQREEFMADYQRQRDELAKVSLGWHFAAGVMLADRSSII